MKILLYMFLLIAVSVSNTKGQGNNYWSADQAYVVDTIEISNPIKIFVKNKGKYGTVLTDSKTYKSFGKRIKFRNIIENKDVYLISSNLYFYLDPRIFPGYENCETTLIEKNRNYEVFKFEENVRKFVLVLVKASFYEKKEMSIESLTLPKCADPYFVQVLYPLKCK